MPNNRNWEIIWQYSEIKGEKCEYVNLCQIEDKCFQIIHVKFYVLVYADVVLNKLSCLLTILTNVNFYQHLNCHNIHTVSFLYSRTVLPVCKPWWWFSVSPSEKVEYKCFWSDCKCNRREGLWDDNSQCWRNCRERNKGTQMD